MVSDKVDNVKRVLILSYIRPCRVRSIYSKDHKDLNRGVLPFWTQFWDYDLVRSNGANKHGIDTYTDTDTRADAGDDKIGLNTS